MTVEDLLDQSGGFGLFQWITTFCLFYNKLMTGWSIFQMAFAGIQPSWVCQGRAGSDPSNWTVKSCEVVVNMTTGQKESCLAYNFTGDRHTAVSEWNLVCDLDWVKKAVTSIQMGGLLVGACLAGQMGDRLGRKKTTYLFVLEHSVLNILAAFCPSWQLFAVCRFFIGVGVGGVLVVAFTYGMEFLPTRWRPVCACLPVWAIGVSIFALTAWRLEDWAELHLICGIFGLPALLGYFFVPESLRFLTVKGRLEEAEAVVARIARTNGKPLPPNTLEVIQAVAQKEKEIRANEAQYTYLDIFTNYQTTKITLVLCFEWLTFSVIFYGIGFGISALAGNIYLNIFLMDALVVPVLVVIFFTQNCIGRKMTAFPLLVLSCAAAFVCVGLLKLDTKDEYGEIVTALSLTAKTGTAACWSVLQTWGTEIYPTVTRNLGYGAANTASRIGGIIVPYAIDFENYKMEAYILIGILLFVDSLILLLLPETKGSVMEDSLVLVPGHERVVKSNSGYRVPVNGDRKDVKLGANLEAGTHHPNGDAPSNGDNRVTEGMKMKPEAQESYGSTNRLLQPKPEARGFRSEESHANSVQSEICQETVSEVDERTKL